MTHFTIQGTNDVHNMKQLGFNILGSKFRKRYRILITLILCGFILELLLHQITYALFFVLFFIGYIIGLFAARRRCYQMNLRRAEELGRMTHDYVFHFEEDHLRYEFVPSISSGELSYSSIVKLIESEACLFLFTKSDLILTINKSDIPAGQLPALAAFLKEKGVKVPSKLVQK